MRIFAEEAAQFEFDNSEDGLPKDTRIHFALAQDPVDEDDGYLLYVEPALVGCKLHFYLKSVAFESDFVQLDGFEYLTAVAYESGSGVVYLQPCDEAYILRGKV